MNEVAGARRIEWGIAFRQGATDSVGARHKIEKPHLRITGFQNFGYLEKLLRDVRLGGDSTVKTYERARIRAKRYRLTDLRPSALYALRGQLNQQTKTFQYIRALGQNMFDLVGVMDYVQDGKRFRMTPPIVETYTEPATGEKITTIIDGLHRLCVARENGVKEVWVIEVSGLPTLLLPISLPVFWNDIKLYDKVPPIDKKRCYRYKSPAEYPDLSSVTSAPITQDNYLYFLYRDFSPLGSDGPRSTK
jgi:hypothetical protein